MSNETTNSTPSFQSIGTTKTLSLTSGKYLVISDICVIKIATSLNSFVAVLYSNNLSITVDTNTSYDLDSNGVYFK